VDTFTARRYSPHFLLLRLAPAEVSRFLVSGLCQMIYPGLVNQVEE
jgi:hypothetical protein